MKLRHQVRRRVLAAVSAIAGLSLLAGCSVGERVESSSGDVPPLTMIGITDTFQDNYNPFTPAGGTAGAGGMILEGLVRVEYAGGGVVHPWLAESWEFSEDGNSVTMKLRDDVTWSDGEKFTADDVVYTLQLLLDNAQLNLRGLDFTSVEASDDTAVTITWDEPAYQKLSQLIQPIVPEHIWSEEDPATFANSNPVVTGPYTVKTVTPQQVTLEARDDYWGGELPVKELVIVPQVAATSQARISKGEIDVTFLATDAKAYVAEDPEHHRAISVADGSMIAVLFNMEQGPFTDPALREAVKHAINTLDLQKVAFPSLPEPFDVANPVGLSSQQAGEFIAPEYQGLTQEQDVDAAKAALAAGGYTVKDGALVSKDGTSQKLKLTYERENPYWNVDNVATLMAQQLKDSLGLDVELEGLTTEARQEAMNNGNFSMAIHYPGSGAGPYVTYQALLSSAAVPIGEPALNNFGRFKNAEFDKLHAELGLTGDIEEQKAILAKMQAIVLEEIPEIPLYNFGGVLLINTTNWEGWPIPIEDYDYLPSPGIGTDMTLTILGLTPAK